jgi:hypothetical protein
VGLSGTPGLAESWVYGSGSLTYAPTMTPTSTPSLAPTTVPTTATPTLSPTGIPSNAVVQVTLRTRASSAPSKSSVADTLAQMLQVLAYRIVVESVGPQDPSNVSPSWRRLAKFCNSQILPPEENAWWLVLVFLSAASAHEIGVQRALILSPSRTVELTVGCQVVHYHLLRCSCVCRASLGLTASCEIIPSSAASARRIPPPGAPLLITTSDQLSSTTVFPCSDGSFSVTAGCRSQEGERSFSTIAVVALVLPVAAIAVVIVYVAFKRHRRAADAVRTVFSLGRLLMNEFARRTTSLGPRQPPGA